MRNGRASSPFADLGAIEDWPVVDRDTPLVEGTNDRRYRVALFGPCIGLQFADAIAFVTEPTGELNRFSSIWVDGNVFLPQLRARYRSR